jgi:putative transposase
MSKCRSIERIKDPYALRSCGAERGFAVLPRRWVVERTLAWLNRNRRLAKDFEASLASAKAWLYLGSIQLLIRRLARA